MLSANRRVSVHKVELVVKEMMTDYDTELKVMVGGEATRRKTGACFWIAMRSTEWISYCYGLAFGCWPVIKPVVTMARLVAQKTYVTFSNKSKQHVDIVKVYLYGLPSTCWRVKLMLCIRDWKMFAISIRKLNMKLNGPSNLIWACMWVTKDFFFGLRNQF